MILRIIPLFSKTTRGPNTIVNLIIAPARTLVKRQFARFPGPRRAAQNGFRAAHLKVRGPGVVMDVDYSGMTSLTGV